MNLKKIGLVFGTLISIGLATTANAIDFPTKPITIIVPSKAGGSTDLTARMFSEVAEAHYGGYKFVIKNVPGSGGQKGFEEIARAENDGHTIGLVFTPQLVAHIASGRAEYTLDSFHIMGNVAQDPGIIVVPKDSAITNLAELTAAAKGEGVLTVAVNGIGSDDFLAAKAYEESQGVIFNLLPTNGSTEQKAGILGGHVDAAFMNLSQMIAQHDAGDARIIAILTEERDKKLDVPTAKEQSVDVMMTATRGFVAPAGVEKKILRQLDIIFEDVVNSGPFKSKAKKGSIDLWLLKGPKYLDYLNLIDTTTKAVFKSSPW